MLEVLLALFYALIPQELGVHWAADNVPPTLSLYVEGGREQSEQCLSSGLEYRHRFEFQLCRRGGWWLDRCGHRFVETRGLQLDPVSQVYKLEIDRFNDGIDPRVLMPDSDNAAMSKLARSDPTELSELLSSLEEKRGSKERYYLLARVLTYCRGDTSRTLRRLSYYLSLGLVRGSVFDSGWVSFDINIPE